MSAAVDDSGRVELPPEWERLERVAEAAAAEVVFWRRRAAEVEEEVARLRRTLEELAAAQQQEGAVDRDEIVRLRAENTALQSRMSQAQKRVGALLRRLSALGMEP